MGGINMFQRTVADERVASIHRQIIVWFR